MDELEKVQHRSTKLIREISGLPYKERLKLLHLPSLYAHRLRGDLIETFKILKGLLTSIPIYYLRGSPASEQEYTDSSYIKKILELEHIKISFLTI